VSTRRPPCAPTVMRELTRVLRAPAARGVVPQVCLRVDSLGISATFLRGWIHLFTHRGRPEGPASVATLCLHDGTGCCAEGTGDGGDGQIGFRWCARLPAPRISSCFMQGAVTGRVHSSGSVLTGLAARVRASQARILATRRRSRSRSPSRAK
jgi:hypothetical protein